MEFTPIDAHAVHAAMIEAAHQAKERKEKMPTSATALESHAADLRVVRDKILAQLPEEQRRAYPDYQHE